MTTVGLIGSGNIGGTVARLAVAAGYDVVLSNSRGPETLTDLVAELGAAAPAPAPPRRRPRPATWWWSASRCRPTARCPVEPLAGKVVIDTNNYYPQRDGQIAELDDGATTSSELLQRHLPDVAGGQGVQQHLLQAPAARWPARRARRPQRAADRRRRRRREGRGDRVPRRASATTRSTPARWPRAGATSADTPAYGTLYSADPADWERPAPADAAKLRAALAAATR